MYCICNYLPLRAQGERGEVGSPGPGGKDGLDGLNGQEGPAGDRGQTGPQVTMAMHICVMANCRNVALVCYSHFPHSLSRYHRTEQTHNNYMYCSFFLPFMNHHYYFKIVHEMHLPCVFTYGLHTFNVQNDRPYELM